MKLLLLLNRPQAKTVIAASLLEWLPTLGHKFRPLFFLWLVTSLLLSPGLSQAQTYPGAMRLTTQAEVNAFPYTEVSGYLQIKGADITNLQPLAGLTKIGGFLDISTNPDLNTLAGLENLTFVGDNLYLTQNNSLSSLAGLEKVAYVGGNMVIENNPQLAQCCQILPIIQATKGSVYFHNNAATCNSQTVIRNACIPPQVCVGNVTLTTQAQVDAFNCSEITGTLYIDGEYDITNLQPLAKLRKVGSLYIGFNHNLISLAGLENITSIEGDLTIGWHGQLKDLAGLKNLTSVGGKFYINGNRNLTNLASLESLTSVGELEISLNSITSLAGLEKLTSLKNLIIKYNPLTSLAGLDNLTTVGGNLEIYFNANLSSLAGLDNLITVGGDLEIYFNDNLSSLAGLEKLTSVKYLSIFSNPQLSQCCLLLPLIKAANGRISISSSNAANCSSPAEIEAACAPDITAQPQATTLCIGEKATFKVEATGTDLTYQWQKNGTAISGAIANTYSIDAASLDNAGNYWVVVTGKYTSITSEVASLRVNPATVITSQPALATACVGTAMSFSIQATGANLSYQWQKNGEDIARATASTYTIAAVTATDAAAYSVVVSGTCGKITSEVAALTLNSEPVITLPTIARVPNETDKCGATVAFAATVSGDPTATLNYKIGATPIVSPYFFPVGTTTVTVTATNDCGTDTKSFQVQVADQTAPVVVVKNATLSLNALGQATLTLADVKVSSSDNCRIVSEQLSKTSFSCENLGTNTVQLTVTDASGHVTQQTATVTVIDELKPTVSTHNLTLTLAATGTATITAAEINNSSDNCSIKSLAVDKTGFTCANIGANTVTLTVIDNSGNVSSAEAIVNVVGAFPTPTITPIPTSSVYTGGNPQIIYLGYGPQSVKLQASGGVSYQWSPASGLNNATIAEPIFTPTTAGSYTFTVTATNSYGCQATVSLTITVIDVRSGKNMDKVTVCHENKKLDVLSIDPTSVQEHLAHGDKLGDCTSSLSPTARESYETENQLSSQVELKSFPNPFSEKTTIAFTLARDEDYSLVIYDMKGMLIRDLKKGNASAGELLQIEWQATNLPAGIYLVRLTTASSVQTIKLIAQ